MTSKKAHADAEAILESAGSCKNATCWTETLDGQQGAILSALIYKAARSADPPSIKRVAVELKKALGIDRNVETIARKLKEMIDAEKERIQCH